VIAPFPAAATAAPVVLAHFGHWYLELLFVAPVLILVAGLSFQSWRENRQGRKDGPGPSEH
jgi:hypothetical protein